VVYGKASVPRGGEQLTVCISGQCPHDKLEKTGDNKKLFVHQGVWSGNIAQWERLPGSLEAEKAPAWKSLLGTMGPEKKKPQNLDWGKQLLESMSRKPPAESDLKWGNAALRGGHLGTRGEGNGTKGGRNRTEAMGQEGKKDVSAWENGPGAKKMQGRALHGRKKTKHSVRRKGCQERCPSCHGWEKKEGGYELKRS